MLGLLLTAVYPRELIFNGDFELPPDSGWQIVRWGLFPDTGNCRLRWQHSFNPDRDFEVLIHKMLHQGMKLYQRVETPSIDSLEFSVSCRLTAKSESDSLFAAAAVCLEFLDNEDSVLGETRVYFATRGCDWQNSLWLHLIPAPDSLNWYDYRFLLRDELESLPGVQPELVKAVRIGLLGFVLDNC
ncbi:hypothetical protein HPY86_00595 [candidate division WOR-3 bacterium]|nr:hypothetical protein [candidate division WOR-3 bacterium]